MPYFLGNFQYNVNFVFEFVVMTAELEAVIGTLNKNIEKLKEQYNRVLEDNKNLSVELLKLKEELKNKEEENESLINKYESLKMAKTIAAASGDAHDAKIKINRLVREIDKCISLLDR
jgi:regulator of replication initiation timing